MNLKKEENTDIFIPLTVLCLESIKQYSCQLCNSEKIVQENK